MGSLVFDGINNYVSVPYTTGLTPTTQITFGCIAYMANWNVATDMKLLSKTELGGYFIGMNSSGLLETKLGGGARIDSAYRSASYPLSAVTSGWHSIFYTFDGRYIKMYLDSINVNTYDHGSYSGITYSYNNHLVIAAEPNGTTGVDGYYFAGKISNVKIYNRSLSQSEISQNYQDLKGRYGL